jgi:phosphoribosyl-ATP pyrophosphohydrolase
MSRAGILERLWEVIAARRRERPAGSYVVSLLDGGVATAGAKLLEEAEELRDAAAGGDPAAVAHEAADLLFHALVLLAAAEPPVEPAAVFAELERRFGTGGLAEKARRSSGGSPC